MFDWWKRYGIFKSNKNDVKKRKLLQKINKYKAEYEARRAEIEDIALQTKLKQQLFKRIQKQLKKYKRQKYARTKLQRKHDRQRKMLKHMQRSLKSALEERLEAMQKLRASKPAKLKHKTHESELPTTSEKRRNKKSKLLATIQRNEAEIERINTKIIQVINDVREIEEIIDYIKRSDCDHIKLKPFIEYVYWMKPPERQMATVVLNKIKRIKNTKHVQQKELNFRRQYILEHIPELKLQMYDYLRQ